MNKKMMFAIICLVIIIFAGVILIIFLKNNTNTQKQNNNDPKQIYEDTFGGALPSLAIVENYTYYPQSSESDDHWCMKVKLNRNDYTTVKNELQKYFNKFGSEHIAPMPNIKNTCSWWDMDNNKIVNSYFAFKDKIVYSNFFIFKQGIFESTKELFAFITKNNSNEYYLYVAD